jgi:hypothetical protein
LGMKRVRHPERRSGVADRNCAHSFCPSWTRLRSQNWLPHEG